MPAPSVAVSVTSNEEQHESGDREHGAYGVGGEPLIAELLPVRGWSDRPPRRDLGVDRKVRGHGDDEAEEQARHRSKDESTVARTPPRRGQCHQRRDQRESAERREGTGVGGGGGFGGCGPKIGPARR